MGPSRRESGAASCRSREERVGAREEEAAEPGEKEQRMRLWCGRKRNGWVGGWGREIRLTSGSHRR
jgi:hypothetical protein